MSEPLVFMMGEFEALFPTDRMYAKNHMWAMQGNPQSEIRNPQSNLWRFGFAAYAVRLLQDVYFLDWAIDADVVLTEGQEIGAIESSKAESSLYSPIAGHLPRLNETLMQDPSAINVDKYGDGWLFEIDGEGHNLLTPEDYVTHLEAVWEVTQKTIKGQLNQ
ncbi:MAG: glycine cleavage system protein H [Pirellulales bacterium]